MIKPFRYPSKPLERIHGPHGYQQLGGFRDWLRDEFSFRCVFCLKREKWVPGRFHLDHFQPVSTAPDSRLEYVNLHYTCSVCNQSKAAQAIPDPSVYLTEPAIEALADGTLKTVGREASKIVDCLGLNDPRYVEFRQVWIRIADLCGADSDSLGVVFGYPEQLPDLSSLRPPGGNRKPEGISESHYAKRRQGSLPETY